MTKSRGRPISAMERDGVNQPGVAELAKLAEAAMARKDYAAAETMWREIGKRHPGSPWGNVGQARLDMALGRLDGAERLLVGTIAQHPGEFGPKAALGDLYLLIGRWEDALLIWDELWQGFPDIVWTYVGRARALAELGKTQGALAVLAEGRERLPAHGGLLREVELEILGGPEPLPRAEMPRMGPASGQDAPVAKVHIYTITFLDMEGRKVYPGGAERYIFDLIDIFAARRLECVIYQAGSTNWVRTINGVRVEALPWRGDVLSLSTTFGTETPPGKLNIYSPFSLAVASRHNPSLGICHGVYWDCDGGTILTDHMSRDVFSALLHLDRVISVDANAINAVRSSRPDLAGRMTYVPNYVGPEFFDRGKRSYAKGQARVLYPRRLYSARGYWLLAEAVPGLLREFPRVQIAFVGDADPAERAHVRDLVKAWPDNVSYCSAHPAEMARHYRWADISVIPTLHSEGTSLSALEALAAGNAVIATNVGGLSNIVIDELNGLLIEPTQAALAEALRRLIEDPGLADAVRDGAIATAHAFRKDRWVKSWNEIVKPVLGAPLYNLPAPEVSTPPSRIRIVHPRTDGIDWDPRESTGLPRQRPHHLLKALHKLGAAITVVSDEEKNAPASGGRDRWEVLGKGAEIHESNPVIFIYYAYHVWALGEIGEAWLATLTARERESFDGIRDNHAMPGAAVWFDLIDAPVLHSNPRYVEAIELFIKHADLVTTTSRVLRERYARMRPDMVLVENACWPEDFLPAFISGGEREATPEVLASHAHRAAGSRIIGYVGAVADWFDFDLVERIANDFPADQIVIAGPLASRVHAGYAALSALPNVSFFGRLRYDALPDLVAMFDVAIIPFRINEITNATNPLKLFEFLAAGITVVATDMAELRAMKQARDLPGLLLANGHTAFSACVAEVLEAPGRSGGPRRQNRRFAIDNSWIARGATALQALSRLGFRPGAADMEEAGASAVALSLNTRAPERVVRITHGKGTEPWICLAGDAIATGDTAILTVPLFAPEKGVYRLDLWITRAPSGMPAGQVSHAVSLNGRELTRYDVSAPRLTTRIVAVAECEAGLHALTMHVTALRPVTSRITDVAAMKMRRISFRRWRDMKPMVVVHGPDTAIAPMREQPEPVPARPMNGASIRTGRSPAGPGRRARQSADGVMRSGVILTGGVRP